MMATPVSGTFGSILAGLVVDQRVGKLDGWQLLILVEGVPAVLVGILIICFLPDAPDIPTLLLSRAEQKLAKSRVPPGVLSRRFESSSLSVVLLDANTPEKRK